MLIEEGLDVGIILVQNGGSLTFKFLLDLLKLVTVVSPHVLELLHHAIDESLDVKGHLLHCLHVVAIFSIQLFHELIDQGLLVIDDLRACCPLNLNVLYTHKKAVRISD